MSSQILEKQMRAWKELLLSGLPLYESIKNQRPEFDFSTPLDPVELKKQEILNNQDYDEYIVSLKHECSGFLHHLCPHVACMCRKNKLSTYFQINAQFTNMIQHYLTQSREFYIF